MSSPKENLTFFLPLQEPGLCIYKFSVRLKSFLHTSKCKGARRTRPEIPMALRWAEEEVPEMKTEKEGLRSQ
jgi:hypothetical protein